jgi:hypothetical protein
LRSCPSFLAAPSRFVPESKFDSIPEPKLIVDDAKVIFDDVRGRTQNFGDLTVLEPLRNQPHEL